MYRTIEECFELIKKKDNETSISKYFIRCLAKKKVVKTLQAGSKFLIDYKSLEQYLKQGDVA